MNQTPLSEDDQEQIQQLVLGIAEFFQLNNASTMHTMFAIEHIYLNLAAICLEPEDVEPFIESLKKQIKIKQNEGMRESFQKFAKEMIQKNMDEK